MQSACSGGTGTFIEKTARKLEIPTEQLSKCVTRDTRCTKSAASAAFSPRPMRIRCSRRELQLRRSSLRCSRRWSIKTWPRSLAATHRSPEILLLGGPNFSSRDCRRPGVTTSTKSGKSAKSRCRSGKDPESLIRVPDDALYYAAQGCIEVGRGEPPTVACTGHQETALVDRRGPARGEEKTGRGGLWKDADELQSFLDRYSETGSDKRKRQEHGNGHRTVPDTHPAVASVTSRGS